MPRVKYSAVLDHTGDAGFRAWAKQLSDALKECLVQTDVTGQVDWTTGTQTRPNAFQVPYWEVYRFSDPLQATCPIFVKVSYGAGATAPVVRLEVATGVTGTGVLQGIVLDRMEAVGPTASVNPQTTYVCYKDGAFTIAWGTNTATAAAPRLVAVIDRTRDLDGAATADGFSLIGIPTQPDSWVPVHAMVNFRTNTKWQLGGSSTSWWAGCLAPPLQSRSSTAAEVSLFNWYAVIPELFHHTALFTYKKVEIADFAELDVAVVGNVARHYVCLGDYGLKQAGAGSNPTSGDVVAILWEV